MPYTKKKLNGNLSLFLKLVLIVKNIVCEERRMLGVVYKAAQTKRPEIYTKTHLKPHLEVRVIRLNKSLPLRGPKRRNVIGDNNGYFIVLRRRGR